MRPHIDATASPAAPVAPNALSQAGKSSSIRVKQRITAVDAARGCAMLMVCLSHIKQHFETTAPALYSALLTTTRVATPTFLLLSGFVIGHLLRGNAQGRVGWLLVDRGLFLVLIAHFLLGLNELRDLTLREWALGRASITDVVGIALIVAVLIRRAPTATLFVAGSFLFVVSWIVAMTLSVQSDGAQLFGAWLFHLHSAPNRLIDVAVLPYLGVFLIGMGLSSYCREALLNGESARMARRLGTIGVLAVVIVFIGIVSWHFGKHSLPESLREPQTISFLRATLHPGSKTPPSPAYLLFYGGVGLTMTALFFHNRPRWLFERVAGKAATLGKASLLCFIVQDWLLLLAPQVFGFDRLTSAPFWLGYFALSVVALYYLSSLWIRIDGNRFFTVGLKRFGKKQLEPAMPGRPQNVLRMLMKGPRLRYDRSVRSSEKSVKL